ncbi:MAG: hypothetical protein ACHP9Y_04960, partial [Gammaproteobacteria bacterium]
VEPKQQVEQHTVSEKIVQPPKVTLKPVQSNQLVDNPKEQTPQEIAETTSIGEGRVKKMVKAFDNIEAVHQEKQRNIPTGSNVSPPKTPPVELTVNRNAENRGNRGI